MAKVNRVFLSSSDGCCWQTFFSLLPRPFSISNRRDTKHTALKSLSLIITLGVNEKGAEF